MLSKNPSYEGLCELLEGRAFEKARLIVRRGGQEAIIYPKEEFEMLFRVAFLEGVGVSLAEGSAVLLKGGAWIELTVHSVGFETDFCWTLYERPSWEEPRKLKKLPYEYRR